MARTTPPAPQRPAPCRTPDQRGDFGDRRLRRGNVGAFGDQRHAVAARSVERVAAQIELRIARLDRAQPLGDHALRQADRVHRARLDLRAALQPRRQPLEHRLHDARHAGHHIHVADLEPRRDRQRVVDQRRAARHRRHALPRGIEIARPVAAVHARPGHRMRLPRHAERGGDAFAGDVVMRRADAAGGEHVVEFRPHFVDRVDDRLRHVGDHPHLAQRYSQLAQSGGQELDVGVLRAAREHLVADHQQTGGGIGRGHRIALPISKEIAQHGNQRLVGRRHIVVGQVRRGAPISASGFRAASRTPFQRRHRYSGISRWNRS